MKALYTTAAATMGEAKNANDASSADPPPKTVRAYHAPMNISMTNVFVPINSEALNSLAYLPARSVSAA